MCTSRVANTRSGCLLGYGREEEAMCVPITVDLAIMRFDFFCLFVCLFFIFQIVKERGISGQR